MVAGKESEVKKDQDGSPLRGSPTLRVTEPSRAWLEQAWREISDTMSDKMLNPTQKKQFVIAILKGQLANPPKLGGYNG